MTPVIPQNNTIDYDRATEDFKYFIEEVTARNPNVDVELLKKTYEFAKTKHAAEKRVSGEPYFVHLVTVACILLENNISETSTLCAALLHDTIEDTEVTQEMLEKLFNTDVATIVEGLTKLNKNKFKQEKAQATTNFDAYNSENLRKIILATAKDVRVMFIKLADRLHNMRTLGVFRDEKQQRITKQTLQVYAPIAEKLGLYAIKGELEDLCLYYTNPEVYSYLEKQIELTKQEREEKTKEIVKVIRNALDKKEIKYTIFGRAKHFYSIYRKMTEENKDLHRIYDLYGIRIVVREIDECYAVQHILEELWPIEKDAITGKPRVKDFIKTPKSNGYQSIHINFKLEDCIIEVQVRTKQMDDFAESGVAKHWKYKATERDKKLDKKIDWLRQLLSWKLNPKNKAAAESYQLDIFGGEIVCVTPKGDPIILKEGSTPLDFAYAVHTKIGDQYERAEVNGDSVLANYTLHSGDIVNIITSTKPMVNKQWLNVVQTTHALTKIRQSLGMTQEKKRKSKDIEEAQEAFQEYRLANKIQIFGKKAPTKISKCCNPQWGQPIAGYYTKDKKITIHRKDCPDRFALDQKMEVKVQWGTEKKNATSVYILAEEIPGVLTQILDIFLKEKVPVLSVNSEERKKNIMMMLQVKNTNEIKDALAALRAKKEIIEIRVE